MTPNEINIAIAELVFPGFREAVFIDGIPYIHQGEFSGTALKQKLPDYYNDLNACAGAEDAIITNPELEQEYYFNINRNYRAKAPERCEGLLRTLGKWKE